MPTGIQSGIEELEEKLKAERAIAERFPDAILGNRADGTQIWWSESAAPYVTDVEIFPVSGEKDARSPTLMVYTYLTIEGMRVYARPSYPAYSLVWLDAMKRKHPEAYKAMVAEAK